MSKPLSIIIITLNESQRIGNLLDDLSRQDYGDFEVLVVDSNSEDDTCDIARSFADKIPQLTVHVMQKRGASLGRNTGATLANNERLLFLDADVRLPDDFLSRSVSHLEQTKLEIAGVYLGAQGLPLHYRVGYWAINSGMFLTQFGFPTAVGACIFSSRRIHQEIKGFDESIALCEDCDYVKRASRTWRFRFIPVAFQFDPRRLAQDGLFRTGWVYLRANIRRFFVGELRNNEIEYKFGHYDDNSCNTSPQTLTQRLSALLRRFKTNP